MNALYIPYGDLKKETIIYKVFYNFKIKEDGLFAFGGKRSNNVSSGYLKQLKFGIFYISY